SVPLADWLRGPLRGWADDLLAPQALAADGLFDPAAVRALWEAHLSGRASHQTVLWNILMMQTWRSGRQVTRACA
ncbi:MAG: asparagine synthetase B, partial [Rhodospirillaceae bacterium]|nr:asparagine synthetase B [Rhodospirillaceae bacterium]